MLTVILIWKIVMNLAISSVATLLKPWLTLKGRRLSIASYLISFIGELLFNDSLCVSYSNIRYRFEKVTKIFFPNRDVILFSYGIISNITCLIKCINSNIINTYCLKIIIYFFCFLISFSNVLKFTLWPCVQAS